MKKCILNIMTVSAVLLFCSCAMYPAPIAKPNAFPMTEPIHFPIIWGDNELFDEKNAPLAIQVVPSMISHESRLSERLKARLSNVSVQAVGNNVPCDMKISIHSEFKEIAPLPQLRMYHILELKVATPEGTPLFTDWSHKSEVAEAYSDAESCRNILLRSASRGMDNWLKNIFSNKSNQNFAVSIVRFRIARYLIDLNFSRMAAEQRTLLNKLRKISGVCNVRLIESDINNKVVSFRVLFRRNQLPYGIANAIK